MSQLILILLAGDRFLSDLFPLFFTGSSDLMHKPFAPYVKPVSPSEIEISWLPVVIPGGVSRYELFNGDELEYSGQDLRYIAKRLKPNTEYKFKLRACGYVLGTCSEFTMFRSGRTEKECEYICSPVVFTFCSKSCYIRAASCFRVVVSSIEYNFYTAFKTTLKGAMSREKVYCGNKLFTLVLQ